MTEQIASLEQNYHLYRDSIETTERTQSIEAEGLFDFNDFKRINEHPETVRLNVVRDGQAHELPLLTPLENYDTWFNVAYYRRLVGAHTPLWYYNHLSPLQRTDRSAYAEALLPALRQLSAVRGILVIDHTDHEALMIENELAALTAKADVTYTDFSMTGGPLARHYHYASEGHPIQPTTVLPRRHLYQAYRYGLGTGEIHDDMVTVAPELSDADIETSWQFYKPAFDKLTADDPVYAGFTESEFIDIMQDPGFAKFVYRQGGAIVNICLLATVKTCNWFNQFYFQQHHPEEYEDDAVYCSPGVVMNPEVVTPASSIRTMKMVGQVLRLSGTEPVITFACDEESNKQVPKLSEYAMRRGGLETNYTSTVGHQLFRMLAVSG